MGMAAFVLATAWAWDERGPEGVPTGRTLDVNGRFAAAAPDGPRTWFDTPSSELGYVARETARELREQQALGTPLASAGMFAELGVTFEDVLATLDLVATVAAEDRGEVHKRLEDPAWIAEQFSVLRWTPDREGAAARKVDLGPDELRLTSYLVFQVDGSTTRTEPYTTALYALPHEEQNGGAPVLRPNSCPPGSRRCKYTRQDVYAGVYDPGGESAGQADPIVWLTRDAANQAVMQGSIEVRTADGRTRMFNVHENNGIPYDPAIKDGNLQPRFWYFREVVGILGVEQIPLRPHAAVAGDIWNIGLGKIVALSWDGPLGPETHLVVLADTGGAFQPNLFQLDWLAGTFPSRAAYDDWARTHPQRVRAAILVRKRPG